MSSDVAFDHVGTLFFRRSVSLSLHSGFTVIRVRTLNHRITIKHIRFDNVLVMIFYHSGAGISAVER